MSLKQAYMVGKKNGGPVVMFASALHLVRLRCKQHNVCSVGSKSTEPFAEGCLLTLWVKSDPVWQVTIAQSPANRRMA